MFLQYIENLLNTDINLNLINEIFCVFTYKADLKNKVSLGFSLITFKVVIPFQPNFYSISTIVNPNIFFKTIKWIFRLSMIPDILYESILKGAAVPKMLNLPKFYVLKGPGQSLIGLFVLSYKGLPRPL